MSQTLDQLLAVYGPVVPLDKVCTVYFGLAIPEARRMAIRNELPVPTMRLRDSQKAPLVIQASALADFIDATYETALESWRKSQVGSPA